MNLDMTSHGISLDVSVSPKKKKKKHNYLIRLAAFWSLTNKFVYATYQKDLKYEFIQLKHCLQYGHSYHKIIENINKLYYISKGSVNRFNEP